MAFSALSQRGMIVPIFSLSALALAIHGFHPYAEDGGVYVPGLKRLLDPGLYGTNPEFVLAPMRTSLFAPLIALLVRAAHIPLAWMLLLIYLASAALTLLAAERIAVHLFSSQGARFAAIALLACWLTLPIAGTSLLLMDPYVTARSLTTPLVLFALAAALDERWLEMTMMIAVAALLHPLMAGYGAAALLALGAMSIRQEGMRRRAAALLVISALAGVMVLHAMSPAETADYREVVMTRYYWFPLQWHSYEQAGALAPLIILWAVARSAGSVPRRLAHAMLLLGALSIGVALIFCRESLATHLVARMQPLRALQLVYVVMILFLGARVGEWWLQRRPLRWAVFLIVAGSPMFLAARLLYPASDHIEFPWREPRNSWQQAFLWVKANTPRTALFAIDSRYITGGRGEDAQSFRAIAERDVLADYSKDGGEVSVAPTHTAAWRRGVAAQMGLDRASDADRLAALRPLSVDWVVLANGATTQWRCPFVNARVRVCVVPR